MYLWRGFWILEYMYSLLLLFFFFIVRYDIRNRLEDKSLFGLKSNIPHRLTDQEEELERLLDEERYLALGTDITEEELLRGTVNVILC